MNNLRAVAEGIGDSANLLMSAWISVLTAGGGTISVIFFFYFMLKKEKKYKGEKREKKRKRVNLLVKLRVFYNIESMHEGFHHYFAGWHMKIGRY